LNGADRKACVIFRKLFVNCIENSSGVFIGTNEANGWTSYVKMNQGIGDLSDSVVSRSVGAVRDPDLVDTAVRDARFIALADGGGGGRQCAVDFGEVSVNAATHNSAVDIGDIKQLGWRTAKKSNYGEGKHFGGNRVSRAVSVVFDEDAVDSPFVSQQNVLDRSNASERNIRIAQKKSDERSDSAP